MWKNIAGVSLAIAISAGLSLAQDHGHDHGATATVAAKGELKVPSSLVSEHKGIHEQLAAAIDAGGKTGPAAKEVERLLSAHFDKEEKHAMKPLSLLAPLARGEKIDPAVAKEAIAATAELRKDYQQMLAEHKEIVSALDKLAAAAKAENNAGALKFVEVLKLHALNEEQILYPAALLVGERLQHAK